MKSLTPERWRHARDLFEQAVEQPAHERAAFLEAACPDEALRAEVEALLAADAAARSLLDRPLAQAAGELVAEMGEGQETESGTGQPGDQVGAYRLLEEIGRGGMSVVYLAERADGQFEQRVALKLIKRGMDSDQVIGRFLQERQILARLEHPGIARLYDGGLTASGRPFFAMELVSGEPLTDHADRHRLSIDARLRLFVQVCEAVGYAHQNLVVHRDLKPSNVFALPGTGGEPNAEGQVKLLDFGIAKLLSDAPGAAVLTRTGVRVLTPAYAAPEQVRGEPVTTQTDVYALGALLYELLTGRRLPTASASNPTMAPRPSSVVQRADAGRAGAKSEEPPASHQIAQARALSPKRLRHRLAGDLDTICLKALRREPERRYASAEELAEDVRRHLDRRPVRARPDTLAYRARTFVARHRGAVASGVVAVLSLVGGLAAALWQADVARQERDEKQVEAARAEAALAYIIDLFADLDPLEAQGRRFTGADLVEPGLRRLHELEGQPLTFAAVAEGVGRLSTALGQFEVADSLLARAWTIQAEHLGPRAPEQAALLEAQAEVRVGQLRYDEAAALLRRARPIRQQAFESRGDGAFVRTLNQEAYVALQQGRLEEAEGRYREALRLHGGTADPLGSERARSLRGLGEVLVAAGQASEAVPVLREALAAYRRAVGASHSDTGRTLFSLAGAWRALGAHERADSLFGVHLRTSRSVYGDAHPRTAAIHVARGDNWNAAGRVEAAAAAYAEAVAVYERAAPGDHLPKALALERLGRAEAALGRAEQAVPPLRQALAMAAALDNGHPIRVPRMRLHLAGTLFRLGQADEAYRLLRMNYTEVEVAPGPHEAEARVLRDQTLKGLAVISEHLGKARAAARFASERAAASGDDD